MQSPMHAAAREYAADGHPVFPLQIGAKTPRIASWHTKATTDPGTIDAWWTHKPASNVAILCGDRADYKLAVLDVDAKHGGEIPSWAPETLKAHTPTGGWHLYYAVPIDSRVRNAVNIGGAATPGLDVRADSGYVVAPPSAIEHIESVPYQWDAKTPWATATIAAIDPALLLPKHLTDPLAGAHQRRFAYRDEVPVGERNVYLTSLAGYLYAQGESEGDVRDALQLEADSLGFNPRDGELAKIAKSVARYH